MPTIASNYCTETGSTTNDTIWSGWISFSGTSVGTQRVWKLWNIDASIKSSTLRRQAEEDARLRKIEAEEADERAEILLHEHLTLDQIDMLEKMREFLVMGSRGNRYLIRRGRAGNVLGLDEHGKPVRRYCAHPAESVPDPDTMLAQKLMLEIDEDSFLRVANVTVLA